tara:strand:- start:57945 stop:58904 length:960 start_codon:yes stop_codon:yes gene_type:complete
MQLIRYFQEQHLSGCVATIGNFDGVHLGHQALLKQLVALSQRQGLPSLVMSFYPLPHEFFHPEQACRLMDFQSKYKILAELGVDYFVCHRFNPRFAQLSAEEFIMEVLRKALRVEHLLVGADFRFGHKATGDAALLKSYSLKKAFSLEVINFVSDSGDKISSSRIRSAILAGKMREAQALLGRPYTLSAPVQHGRKKGRELGFPTANLSIHPKFIMLNGVYTCWVNIAGKQYQAVANVGYAPTVKNQKKTVEVHVLDFSGDLYGQRIEVAFLDKVRDELKFPSLAELIDAIKHDIMSARQFFAEMTDSFRINKPAQPIR